MSDAPEIPTAATGKAVSSVTVSHVIVRGCARCRGPREIGEPCASCGNPEPAEVTELGVASAAYRNPLKRAWWTAVGKPLADRRIRRANERTLQLQARSGPPETEV